MTGKTNSMSSSSVASSASSSASSSPLSSNYNNARRDDNDDGNNNDDNDNNYDDPISSSSPRGQSTSSSSSTTPFLLQFFGTVLSLSVHGLLLVIFLVYVTVCCTQSLYDEYFIPIVQRAKRTDDDLLLEYTYYTRECSLIDLTADISTAHQLVVDVNDWNTTTTNDDNGDDPSQGPQPQERKPSYKKPSDQAVDTVMLHGAVMIPSLLQDSTIDALRKFVVRKNEQVRGTAAQYPVSQGRNRISYGIEATEDEAVVTALKELHDHQMLKETLERLVGSNPALSEITAITAHYGAGPQAWHSDTKADGNAVLYGRTYEHSYSLFIPLQDTIGEMGPTDLCPGTHYCADDNLEYVCELHKIGLHQIRQQQQQPQSHSSSRFVMDDGTYQNHERSDPPRTRSQNGNDDDNNLDGNAVWRRGDAVLLNQQVWHRGAAHEAYGSPDRIVFIVSFLGRPTSDDPRQLARGTYFHMKWNMWGHTWQDMADSLTSMARPWSILRCLHLWKPADRDWGYDLFTSAALRIANQQLGCEPSDLQTFISEVMVPLGSPRFLDGVIDLEHDEAWLIYFSGTIRNYMNFFQKINIASHGIAIWLLLLLGFALRIWNGNGARVVLSGVGRTMLTHGLVLGLAALILRSVHNSQWATDIQSGKTLMRPFPIEAWNVSDPTVSDGRTTLPRRFDVLVGTRYDSPNIGIYSHWLDYHYGNRIFDDFVNTYGGSVYRSLPSNIAPRLVHTGVELVTQRDGRFLQQDYRSGSWRELNPTEVNVYVRLQMIVGKNTLLEAILTEINVLYDHYRFGVPSRKQTSMAWQSQRQLDVIARRIFSVWLVRMSEPSSSLLLYSLDNTNVNESSPTALKRVGPKLIAHRRHVKQEFVKTQGFRLFDEVEYRTPKYKTSVFYGTIVGVNPLGGYNVVFYSEAVYRLNPIEYGIPAKMLKKRAPIIEGRPVMSNFEGGGEFYPGRVVAAWPDGAVDILYDDNDVEVGVLPGNYWGR